MKKIAYIVLFLLLPVISGCDGGLTPPPEIEPGFSGEIVFRQETWPPIDSLYSLWLFASQIYPTDSIQVFNGIINTPPAIYLYPSFTENLPFQQDTLRYFFPLPPGTYIYIGVLHRFRNDISVSSLQVVGVYKDPADTSKNGRLIITEHSQFQGINIKVDFHNLPIQPFR